MRLVSRIALIIGLTASPYAMACQNTGNFSQWLQQYKQTATQAGIKPAIVNKALANVKFAPDVIKRDRSQTVFAQTFTQFAGKKVSSYRLKHGRRHLRNNSKLFNRIERRYGVPAEVITAFWALETDFGAVTGNYPTLNALATLAYDCRRPELFRNELTHALWLIQKGDQSIKSMKGAWAGELGQLQFLPAGYNKHAVDFNGDGKRDLIRSKEDALASAASLLKHYGWRAGQPWLVEVRVPKTMDWSLARLDRKLPLSTWKAQGVTYANGKPLKNNGSAALILPMGRNGVAFLAYPNFDVYLKWNKSVVYSTTAAYLATRFAGAKPMRKGNAPVKPLSLTQTKRLQKTLRSRGYPIKKIDGIIGENTRAAVRQLQQKLGLPADGYPDQALLRQL